MVLGKISIVIPVYNVEKYIEKCVFSILEQSFSDFELILVDDGSTDGSLGLLEGFQESSPDKVRVITQQNKGASVARNAGIVESKSDYIMFVDSDDFLEKDMLELMYESAIKNDSDLVLCNAKVVTDEECKFIREWSSGELTQKVQSIFENKDLINTVLPAPWGKLYKKELFTQNEISFPLGLRNQDLGTTPRILSHCNRISKVNKPLYNYRYRTGSAMRTYDYKIMDAAKNLEIVKRYFEKRDLAEEFSEQLEYLFIEHLLFRAIYRVKFVEEDSLRNELTKNICLVLNEEFPNWYKNKNISNLPFKKKVYLNLVRLGHIGKVMNLFQLKKKFVG